MIRIGTLLAAALLFFGSGAVPVHAQTPAVQKAFEEVRTKLDDLISAKDENLADDLALRIQAFKKVVEFSKEESKNLRVKLISTELESISSSTLAAWKARMEKGLIDAEIYYDKILGSLTTTTTSFDLKNVRKLATTFKEWRETSFAPLATEVEGFLLVVGQRHALEVAQSRFTKIKNDVTKLERAKIRGVARLAPLLDAARAHLDGANDAYARASTIFIEIIVPPPIEASGDESATSTSVADAEKVETPPSLRDEIRTSLEGIKRAYRTFIEMSVEVKKILK